MLKRNFIQVLVYKPSALAHGTAQETGKLIYHFIMREKYR